MPDGVEAWTDILAGLSTRGPAIQCRSRDPEERSRLFGRQQLREFCWQRMGFEAGAVRLQCRRRTNPDTRHDAALAVEDVDMAATASIADPISLIPETPVNVAFVVP